MGQTLENLGEARKEHLKQVEQIEAMMLRLVRREFREGASLRSLARRARVTHPTIAKWVSR